MMCLQAHYRSELEFSWEGLGAALVRLKRMVGQVEKLKIEDKQVTAADLRPALHVEEKSFLTRRYAMILILQKC